MPFVCDDCHSGLKTGQSRNSRPSHSQKRKAHICSCFTSSSSSRPATVPAVTAHGGPSRRCGQICRRPQRLDADWFGKASTDHSPAHAQRPAEMRIQCAHHAPDPSNVDGQGKLPAHGKRYPKLLETGSLPIILSLQSANKTTPKPPKTLPRNLTGLPHIRGIGPSQCERTAHSKLTDCDIPAYHNGL